MTPQDIIRAEQVHRIVYRSVHGSIPDGMEIAADPEKMAEERQDRGKWYRRSGKKSKAGQRRKNEG